GYRWTGGNRDQPAPPLRGIASRVDQAYTNFMETFPFFAALLLACHFAGRDCALTLWGSQLYFWGRLGYVLAAAAGFGLVRSVLFFNAATFGIVLFLIALLR
ncbi:MAG TPA: MAPEG family protein, partial [Chthoniobacterales bacterium]|nr:MAPEG family protein [Chthoniobacterales bacterium]